MEQQMKQQFPQWEEALSIMRHDLPATSFKTWIEPLEPLLIQGNRLFLLTQTFFHRNTIMSRYIMLISNAYSQVTGTGWDVELIIPEEKEAFLAANQPVQRAAQPVAAEIAPGRSTLNPKYTFDSFVVGNSNRFAQAASLAVAEDPAVAYNPLFIYGGVGLGKTHLMHAIGNFILAQNPNKRIVYVSCEQFTNDLINAIRSNTTEQFRQRYRNADVLLIDDIQFITGKEQTQEELFHTFNTLHDAQKQIILSSDKTPKEMSTLEDRLRSRFEWGLIADIQPPDLETRVAILNKKAEEEHLPSIDYSVMEFIATRSENNIRELEGALTRVIAYSRLKRMPIDIELAGEALKDIIETDSSRKVTPQNIMQQVCQMYDLDMKDMVSHRRNKEIAYPRQIAMYLIREMTDFSLTGIGNLFGGKDHTTVLHAWRTISAEVGENHDLRVMLADIRKKLMGK